MIRNWPEGKHVAVLFDVMFEGWGVGVGPGMGPMGNPIKPGYLDTTNLGWGKYAIHHGMERLLKVYDEEGITGGVFVSGTILEQCPELVKLCADKGHEIILHGDLQDELPVYLEEAVEREKVERSIRMVKEITGKTPVGSGSPRFTESPNTQKILVENGVKYTTDWLGSDLPLINQTPAGEICLLPFTMNINDMPISVRFGHSPQMYYDAMVDEFEGWFRDHPEEKAVVWITAHTHVYGRPYGAAAFKKCMQYIKSLPYVWIAQPHEVASTVIDIEY